MDERDDQNWNEEILEDVKVSDVSSLVVYSRDWTVETIVTQINQKNIDLNPKFQRRNAWNDVRRSKLIESLIVGIPVPEIVLAEDPTKKKSFIVIDGKQRLLTIAGFVDPSYDYWEHPILRGLKTREDLNGRCYDDLKTFPTYDNEHRSFFNADIRCTVLSNYKNTDVLYDVFYRLNSSSAPLSTQELRQVLIRGSFADYLVAVTNKSQPIHNIIGSDGPDPRLRDVELILRFMSFKLFGNKYQGNLKKFLDDSMSYITKSWKSYKPKIDKLYELLNASIKNNMTSVFGVENIGRKFVGGKWESRFNKVLFEVEMYYFSGIPRKNITESMRATFLESFKKLCSENEEFRRSIETTTKTRDNYIKRYKLFGDIFNRSFKCDIKGIF